MEEKPLLLPSANRGVLMLPGAGRSAYIVRYAALAFGLLCIVVGAADVTARVVDRAGSGATFLAFAPAAALIEQPQTAATSTAVGAITPARLRIPSLGVDAAIEHVGVKEDGSMGTPKDFKNVAWYAPGAKPGGEGSAVFAGHVNNGLVNAGVFAHLTQIKKGDYVSLADSAGRTKVYRVASIGEYAADAPTDALFAPTGSEQIVLITCDGAWVPSARTFEKRLVIIAKPAY